MIIDKPEYYDEIKSFITSFHKLSEDNLKALFQIANFKLVKSNIKLDDLGDIPNKIYVLNKGVLRSYVILESGKEVTETIFVPTIIFASYTALISQTKSDSIYETLTDCELYEIDYYKYKKMYETNTEILTFHAKFLEYLLSKSSYKHVELLTMNAKQRYLMLRSQIPNIDNLIPQYQIAAYLSITPVQLSRIRGKL